MTVAYLGSVAAAPVASGTGAAATFRWTLTSAVPAGTALFAGISCVWVSGYAAGASATVTDSKGNTWSGYGDSRLSAYQAFAVACVTTVPLAVGDTIDLFPGATINTTSITAGVMHSASGCASVLGVLAKPGGEAASSTVHEVVPDAVGTGPIFAAIGVAGNVANLTALTSGVTEVERKSSSTNRFLEVGFVDAWPSHANVGTTTSTAYNGVGLGYQFTPAAGDGTLTLLAEPTLSPPSVRLDLSWTAGGTVTVERQDPDGRWWPVRTGDPAVLSSGAWLGHDVEAPYGLPVRYRASNGTTTVTGMTAEIPGQSGFFDPDFFDPEFFDTDAPGSASVPASPTVTLTSPVPWLIHPGVPAVSVPLSIVRDLPARVRRIRQGRHDIIGRADPIVVSQVRSTAEWTMTVGTVTDAQRKALDAILDDGSVLLLNIPAQLGWGLPASWVSISDVTESRLVNYGAEGRRDWQLPMVVVSRPVGGQIGAWTWDALGDAYATWDDVGAAFSSWRAVLFNEPS